MCGIAGFVTTQVGSPDRILKKMTDRMRLRGPDGEGQWISASAGEWPSGLWKAALGHRRLSIIDLDGGAQPLGNENGSVQISFNGEIFNFLELKPGLEKKGHVFKTRSDTEVLLHHYLEHGTDGFARLNGMFAVALWDQARQRLVLARDRAGVKPLYYSRLPDGGVAFASELMALAQHPEVSREITDSALAAYFFSDYVHAPEAIFKGVRKLEPGHFMVWENGKLFDPRPFWSKPWENKPDRGAASVSERVSELRGLLESSVEKQLISDVPVGVFLSGGIDSSLVAALASGLARKKGGAPVRTFSIAFEDPDFDESAYARAVARHLGTEHREETLSENELLASLDSALGCLDEPMADPSILPTYLLSRLAAREVKVALGGDAGDELFAGYPTYRAHRFSKYYERVPATLREQVIERMVARLPVKLSYQSLEWKAKRFALRWDADPVRRHLRWLSATDLPELGKILGRVDREPRILSERENGAGRLNRILALDFQTYLPGSVLCKVDRASMGNSLEVRPPFLDNAVIDWAFTLPDELKLRGQTSKFILKEAARGLIPDEIIFRKKKGFAIPLGRWLRGPLKSRLESILRESPAWDCESLRREGFVSWAAEHFEGRMDRSKPLWSLMVLDHWMRKEGLHGKG